MIKLKLTVEDVQGILNVLGELPTKSNAWPLVQKIEAQVAEQTPSEEPEASLTD
jgi:hypothetical protein